MVRMQKYRLSRSQAPGEETPAPASTAATMAAVAAPTPALLASRPAWAKHAAAEAQTLTNRVAAVEFYQRGVQLYNEGDLHSPKREGPTSLIRIEGTNMAKVKRFKYQPV